jgi:3-hydroxyisobutyrate dehydrogenase-like beta-hydroxyacid dehydrogenase
MNEIGFIGLGAMGARMAWNLHDAGYSLRVYNRSREKAEPFEDDATVCETPAEAANGADAVFTMVAGGDALMNVLRGDEGVLAGIEEDMVIINTSTVAETVTEEAADLVTEQGGRFVDSPVSGTTNPAEQGTLTVLAGGDEDSVESVTSLLETIGEPVIHCGAVGQGTNMKLFINLLLGEMMEGFAEAMVFGEQHDLGIDEMLEVVDSGALAAPLFQAKGQTIRNDDFEPQFSVELLSKDLDLILDAAGEADVPLPATAATREAASATRGLGYGGEDMAALIKHIETLAGTEVRDDE